MTAPILYIILLAPLGIIIAYYDVRYRRIPNAFVLATLCGGLAINTISAGFDSQSAAKRGQHESIGDATITDIVVGDDDAERREQYDVKNGSGHPRFATPS